MKREVKRTKALIYSVLFFSLLLVLIFVFVYGIKYGKPLAISFRRNAQNLARNAAVHFEHGSQPQFAETYFCFKFNTIKTEPSVHSGQ